MEFILAHPTGITEVDEGTLSIEAGALVIDVSSTSVGRSGSAKEVSALRRVIRVDGDELRYSLAMAAVGLPLQHHLSATLHRVP